MRERKSEEQGVSGRESEGQMDDGPEGKVQKEDQDIKREEQDSFLFLQETIKPKAVRREEILLQAVKMAVYGLIMGSFACCSFYALRPWAEQTFQEEPQEVTIPKDEEETVEEEPEEVEETEPVVPVLTADNYGEIMQNMYEIGKEAEKSIVTLRANTEEEWMEESGRRSGTTGLIAADNGRELLIIADNSICEGNEQWTITFTDRSEYQAVLHKQDRNRGLAVFGVEKSSVTANTMNAVQVAELGNSNVSLRGDIVFALGEMFGYDHGIGYGIISTKEHALTYADGQCGIITTDIAVAVNGKGVLFDRRGQVIGLIRGAVWEGSATANAMAISDLKPVLELLLNEENVPYIGIYGSTVSEELSSQQEIPKGLYVTNVQADSPAMKAGIQNGDVILEIGDAKVTGMVSYEKAMLGCRAGTNVKVKGQRRGAGGYVDVDFMVTVGNAGE